jgi:transposase
MKKIRDVIRIASTQSLSIREIALATGVSRPTVSGYIDKFRHSGLSMDEVGAMSDTDLTRLFDAGKPPSARDDRRDQLFEQFPHFSKELLRTGVTLQVLWEEYIAKHPEGYRYSQFCDHYRTWKGTLELSMHQEYKAGDKLFVDFTGKKLFVTDPVTGEAVPKEVFVAILGASQYTYVEATDSQKREDFIRASENTLHYYGGSPRAFVPDCLKSAVTKGDKYEPEINPEYQDFADHYGVCVLPARPHEPRDKAHVENAVKIVYSRIFAALRDRVFHSLTELNDAILEQLELYNNRKMQKLQVSRKELFMETELPALQPLRAERYQRKNFAQATVQFNYHVLLREDGHYYSVPYRCKGKKADITYNDRAVEIFVDHLRVASHLRDRRKHVYTTHPEHMPPQHRWVSDWNPERFTRWAEKLGPNVGTLVQRILAERPHPEQGYKACLGVLSLEKKYTAARLDKACARALFYRNHSYSGVKKILEKGLDGLTEATAPARNNETHGNIRGEKYYAQEANQ